MMDSKEGIEKVAPVDAQAAGLLDPSFLRPGTHDADTADLPRERAGSPTWSCALLDEHSRWESNCLYVRVLRDSDAILEQDRKVPEYCWNAGISKDICEAQTGVVPGTFSMDLLSDTEFLVYRVPKTTRGMSDREARYYADLIMGSYLWAGSPATILVTKQTTQEARRDKIKMREYRRKITVRRLAAAQARLKDLEMVTQKRQESTANPVVRGRGMIRRADKYQAQRHGKEPEWISGTVPILPTFPDRPATRMTTTQHGSTLSQNTTLRKWIPKRIGMMWRGMMTMCLSAPTQHPNPAVIIWTELIERLLPTGPRGVTSGSVRKVGGGVPPMLGRKRKGVRARWFCLYSGTPRRKVP